MNAVVEALTAVPGQRVVAVSDVHGHLANLRGLLARVHWTPDDLLILCGDLVEKGPESLSTLRFLLDLRRRAALRAVMGNCDLGVLLALRDESADTQAFFSRMIRLRRESWGGGLLLEMLREQGLDEDCTPLTCIRRLNAAYREELGFLRGLPTVLSGPKHLFVHAGLPTADERALPGCSVQSCVKLDAFADCVLRFSKWVIAGHWPACLYHGDAPRMNPSFRRSARIVSIDGGCVLKPDGQLNALLLPDLTSEDFSFAAYDGLPLARALDAQKDGGPSLYLRWGDDAVEVRGQDDHCARVRHRRTGRVLLVPRGALRVRGGVVCCPDMTDHRPAVAPGTVLTVVERGPEPLGWLVKRGGVSGWYRGRLEFLSPEKSNDA